MEICENRKLLLDRVPLIKLLQLTGLAIADSLFRLIVCCDLHAGTFISFVLKTKFPEKFPNSVSVLLGIWATSFAQFLYPSRNLPRSGRICSSVIVSLHNNIIIIITIMSSGLALWVALNRDTFSKLLGRMCSTNFPNFPAQRHDILAYHPLLTQILVIGIMWWWCRLVKFPWNDPQKTNVLDGRRNKTADMPCACVSFPIPGKFVGRDGPDQQMWWESSSGEHLWGR